MYYSDYSSCDPEKEAETAYSDYVNTLPAQGYDSSGTLLWQPRWIEDTKYWDTKFLHSGGGQNYILQGVDGSPVISDVGYTTTTIRGSCIRVSFSNRDDGQYMHTYFSNSHLFSAPVDGKYTCVTPVKQVIVRKKDLDGVISLNVEKLGSKAPYSECFAGEGVPCGGGSSLGTSWIKSGVFEFYAPIYKIEPVSTSPVTNNYYISTRVNNFNGDYYNSVTNNYYNNTTIVNETTNNYYDMTTNNNYTMSNWSYDYASRTYFITLEDGTTVTVQFGDDCMTITKNDVTNSYQYVIKNNSTPDTPTGCKHDWQETIDTAPTCLEGGHASYTCSLCGKTYEQNLAAKGHDWKVIEHVNMVYNSDGTVATQGHTLYQCSVCGEQWYTDTGAPPPDVSGSSTIIAWLTNFQTWLDGKFGLFVDKLQVVVDNSTSTVENTVINITQDNDAFNVFYIEDKDGNTQSVTEFAGDLTGASGKLLSLLYRLVFADALGGVDDDLDGFEDFFTSQEPVTNTATQSMDDTVNEVMDVWAS